MTGQERVTDEQLTDLANWGPSLVPPGLFVDVVADLRASRAREAEARAQATRYYERGLQFVREAELVAAERDEMRANWRAALATEAATAAELGGLQQRIDKALAVCSRAGVMVHSGDIVAALSGTEDTEPKPPAPVSVHGGWLTYDPPSTSGSPDA